VIKTEGLNHIHLRVGNLDRSVGFSTKAFGLVEKFRVGSKMVFLGTPGAGDTITLNLEPGAVGPGGGILHFGFRLAEGQDLDRAIEEVRAAGGSLIERGEHEPGMPFAYVADPDGYVIEL
jgi:catechol 2,3-dioxygenase-like lactoylglutathione lyase family enzyme